MRVINTQPAPVIPIFSDENGAHYQQNIDESGTVAEFQKIDSAERTRNIIHVQNQLVEKNIGDSALFAIEYKEKQVRFGSKNTIKDAILDFHKKDLFKNHPFTLLEYAILVKSEELITSSLLACKYSLENISPVLFRKWIDGSDLTERHKQLLKESSKEETSYIHLSFSNTFQSLVNLTDFSRVYLHRYRKDTFGKAVDDIIQNGMHFLDPEKVNSFFDVFLQSIGDIPEDNTEIEVAYRFYVSESRGNIKLTQEKYEQFVFIVENSVRKILNMLPKMDTREKLHVNLLFFSNRSRLIVMIFYLYYFHKFNEFEDFLKKRKFLPPFIPRNFAK
jgi:hypothetical protein